MKYLGIDYGTKKIGIAISNDDGTLAFPRSIISNTKDAIPTIAEIVAQEKIEHIVMGESRNFKGEENKIYQASKTFSEVLKEATGITTCWEPEFMTSAQARSTQGNHDMIDASAAALILQTFLDRKQKTKALNTPAAT
jgi:putative Holliday junction resolvase